MKARPHTQQKYVFSDGAIVEIRIWLVPRTHLSPEGYKYSLVYIDPEGMRVLGYDNAEGKGHHRHRRDREETIEFTTIEMLTEGFIREVRAIRGGRL